MISEEKIEILTACILILAIVIGIAIIVGIDSHYAKLTQECKLKALEKNLSVLEIKELCR